MLLFYFRTEYNKLDTKKGRAADVDTWVCQYSKRKLGGFHCPKMMRVKRFRDQHGLSGLIDVERNDQPHDHSQEQEEEEDRVYQIYDSTDYDFAANVNDFAAKCSRLICNDYAANFLTNSRLY